MMNEKDFITFHVAIKVPRLKQAKELKGYIKVTAENLAGSFNTKISAFVSTPFHYLQNLTIFLDYSSTY